MLGSAQPFQDISRDYFDDNERVNKEGYCSILQSYIPHTYYPDQLVGGATGTKVRFTRCTYACRTTYHGRVCWRSYSTGTDVHFTHCTYLVPSALAECAGKATGTDVRFQSVLEKLEVHMYLQYLCTYEPTVTVPTSYHLPWQSVLEKPGTGGGCIHNSPDTTLLPARNISQIQYS